jgi:predicted glutamine amidotransferase
LISINRRPGARQAAIAMCELFAMSSRHPTDARASLEAFARHGGLEGPHKDGWGLATTPTRMCDCGAVRRGAARPGSK